MHALEYYNPIPWQTSAGLSLPHNQTPAFFPSSHPGHFLIQNGCIHILWHPHYIPVTALSQECMLRRGQYRPVVIIVGLLARGRRGLSHDLLSSRCGCCSSCQDIQCYFSMVRKAWHYTLYFRSKLDFSIRVWMMGLNLLWSQGAIRTKGVTMFIMRTLNVDTLWWPHTPLQRTVNCVLICIIFTSEGVGT